MSHNTAHSSAIAQLPTCHYCGIPLLDAEATRRLGVYHPPFVDFEQCHCGEHNIAAGEPCVEPASWTAPSGTDWLTVDHRTPQCRGGTDDPLNLVPSCLSCNARKGTLPYMQVQLEGYGKWPAEVGTRLQPSWGLAKLRWA